MLDPGNNEKYDNTTGRIVAGGLFAIGLAMACWFWPADLDSSGAALYASGAVLMAIASGVLAVLLWE